MVFVLDNYDSFTYNLVQYLGELGQEILVRRNDEITPAEIEALQPDRILISPGPCPPQAAGLTVGLIQHFAARDTAHAADPAHRPMPILGVCLGHQAIGQAFGGEVIRAPRLMHGKTSEIEHDGRSLFTGIPSTTTCTRYHSLIVCEENLPATLEISAHTPEASSSSGRVIMGLRHRSLPIEGVQFHPESVLTTHGREMIANFLKL